MRCWHRRPDVGQNAEHPDAVRPLRHEHHDDRREAGLRVSERMSEPTNTATNEPGGWRWLWLTLVMIVLDQVTKLLIVQNFEYGERLNILPVFDLILVYNTGAAFSFLAQESGWQRWFFAALALIVGAIILGVAEAARRRARSGCCRVRCR